LNILIIGSEGFIGSHFIAYYSKTATRLVGVDIYEQSATDYEYRKISRLSPEFDETLKTYHFDAIINCAGSGNVPYSMDHPLIDFEANCFDTIRILDAVRIHNPAARYVHFSSAAVYGNPRTLPVRESDDMVPMSPYGWHKIIAEMICREYHYIYGLQVAIVRPFSVFGPGLRKQLFWDIYQKVKQTNKITMHGSGSETRDFVFIHDVVHAVDIIVRKGEMEASSYNIASGKQLPVSFAISCLLGSLNKNAEVSYTGVVRNGDPLYWCADLSKINALGFTNKYSFEAGIKELAQWLGTL